jgi:hypothetical protein
MSTYEYQVFRVRLIVDGENCYLTAEIAKRQWRHMDRLDDGWEFVTFIPKKAVVGLREQNDKFQFALFRKQSKQDESGLGDRPYHWARKVGRAC